MGTAWDTFLIVAQIAFRNLFASRAKTLVISGIVLFGAFLVVFGTSMLDSVDAAMKRSIVGSVSGDIQVYSSESDDELDVMGGFDIEGADLEPIERFEDLRGLLLDVPNVREVVPMGISGAVVPSGNTIDMVLADLRDIVKRRHASEPGLLEAYQARKGHVRRIVGILRAELANVSDLLEVQAADAEDAAESLARADSSAFWDGFDADPLAGLEFLENNVAPVATDADMLGLRYLGTDPAAFARAFDRFEIVDGEMIPPGKPGFLFAKFQYERQIKMKTARNLDEIKRIREMRDARIAEDDELKRLVRENQAQVKEILLQLSDREAEHFQELLVGLLDGQDGDLPSLLRAFFNTTDDDFAKRYAFFYEKLAPSLNLYRVPVGSKLTIKAFTRGGYVRSVNVPVYGTFTFKGLENSPQVGALNLIDLVSFRDLYGYLTASRKQEIAAIRAEVDVQDVTRDGVEAALFGAAPPPPPPPSPASPASPPSDEASDRPSGGPTDLDAALSVLSGVRQAAEQPRTYDPEDLQRGIVLNAAVLLEDPSRLAETRQRIEAAAKERGMPLKAVSWQEASGLTGQFVTLMRLILVAAVLIIFVVAMVIISNSLVMATLERVQEIGTLRALGAQRSFVLAMLMVESVLVGLVFGLLGALLGAGVIGVLGVTGWPAFNDVMTFFFSGRRLYPTLGGVHVALALTIVLIVSVLSCLYPAWIALRVSPRQAMQSEE
ncbi:MAG: FtsX-like permease family protein [Myxococcales bacterium]|nr:FtsX-like permease family protein [Myxococcales bacterium]